jgi:hypothetical protein
MGALDVARFEAIVNEGCRACGRATLEISSYLDRSVPLMLADPTDVGRWAHDGEKFVDGTYRITCVACRAVVFESTQCPRCHAEGGLARALGEPSRLRAPKRCPGCNEIELLALAMVPAAARVGGGLVPKPAPLVDFSDPGYHLVAYACDACDRAVVAEGCPLCGAAGPLRDRP